MFHKYLDELQYLNKHFPEIDPNFPFEAHDTFMNIASKVAHLAILGYISV